MVKLIASLILTLAAVVCPASSQTPSSSRLDKASDTAQQYKQKYWDCLSSEILKMVPTAISATDFKLYLEGSCPDEKQRFRVAFVDYLGMKHPDIQMQEHFGAFDQIVELSVADSVKGFIELRLRQ